MKTQVRGLKRSAKNYSQLFFRGDPPCTAVLLSPGTPCPALPMPWKAKSCTLVTGSLRLVPKKSKSWLLRSTADFRSITPKMMQRHRGWSCEILDSFRLCKTNSHSYRSDEPIRDAHWGRESERVTGQEISLEFSRSPIGHVIAGACSIDLQRQAGHRCNGFCRSHARGSR